MAMEWVFAYGSLIWRPGFEWTECQKAYLRGWTRRFWQGSPDHRGTPIAPGRVVTLVAEPSEDVYGVAFKISPDRWQETVALPRYPRKWGLYPTHRRYPA